MRQEERGRQGLPPESQPIPERELPEAEPGEDTFVAEDAEVRRGTPGEAGSEVAERPPAGGEDFPGGGDMEDERIERELEDL